MQHEEEAESNHLLLSWGRAWGRETSNKGTNPKTDEQIEIEG